MFGRSMVVLVIAATAADQELRATDEGDGALIAWSELIRIPATPLTISKRDVEESPQITFSAREIYLQARFALAVSDAAIAIA